MRRGDHAEGPDEFRTGSELHTVIRFDSSSAPGRACLEAPEQVILGTAI
jgi:hypothetical protein